jgi:hypothetical protein
MTALMNHGEHGGNQIILMVVSGNSDILIVEIGGVGMLGFRNAAMAAVNSHNLHQFIGKLTLYSHGIMTEQESVLLGDGEGAEAVGKILPKFHQHRLAEAGVGGGSLRAGKGEGAGRGNDMLGLKNHGKILSWYIIQKVASLIIAYFKG